MWELIASGTQSNQDLSGLVDLRAALPRPSSGSIDYRLVVNFTNITAGSQLVFSGSGPRDSLTEPANLTLSTPEFALETSLASTDSADELLQVIDLAGLSTDASWTWRLYQSAISEIETGRSMKQMLRLMGAVLLGKASSNGSVFRDVNDSKARVTATVDNNGNRTAVTLDQT